MAYQSDLKTLTEQGYDVEPDILQPGYIRAIVRKGEPATKVEWAQDSTWRFMPVIRSERFGFQLHPVDLAIHKVLALAAVGKDPGFSPRSLLELLRRRGKIRPEHLARLDMAVELDVREACRLD